MERPPLSIQCTMWLIRSKGTVQCVQITSTRTSSCLTATTTTPSSRIEPFAVNGVRFWSFPCALSKEQRKELYYEQFRKRIVFISQWGKWDYGIYMYDDVNWKPTVCVMYFYFDVCVIFLFDHSNHNQHVLKTLLMW